MQDVFPGRGKRGAYSTYRLHVGLLDKFGQEPLVEDCLMGAEKFICALYKTNESSCDDARHLLFGRVSAPELLPPTSDAAGLHF